MHIKQLMNKIWNGRLSGVPAFIWSLFVIGGERILRIFYTFIFVVGRVSDCLQWLNIVIPIVLRLGIM